MISRSAAGRIPDVIPLDGSAALSREVVGNKGFGVNAMRAHGLPVPPAFCVSTNACARWFDDPVATMEAIWPDVLAEIGRLEDETSRTFGAGPRPLLVSVRSGAAQSMPGMLDTVLNLGINDAVEKAMAQEFSESFARDTHERFRRMYRSIVLADDHADVPDDPHRQLRDAIQAVFKSWNGDRAVTYRRHHGLNDIAGTAVVVQAMVFGNRDTKSGTGVLFTRDPRTGANTPFGEWLAGGQGEDVVSGTVDVEPISALAQQLPSVYDELMRAARSLEELTRDVQDIEFTVEDSKLWLLQTRRAKRSAQAAVRLALAFRREGLIDDVQALSRVTPDDVRTLLMPALQPETRLAATLLASGLAASPGVATGRAYTDVDEAIDAAERDEDVILVRTATSPDDVAGMLAARGIVTETGGATSHAAVVSRELGRPSVVGCGRGVAEALDGKLITVDGNEGEVREGVLELTAWSEDDSPDLKELTEIAYRHSALRAGAPGDTPLVTMLTAIQRTQEGDTP
ncbi:pyruvate, phosphate dikinase [Mycobacterium hubeiense]|uniref:pyruvate, phosphate dikinase n=1 Tax=Mycobacterium hubeiense TaxID=1867256 RepID=UPI001E38DF1B|nr:pyruvate, phosphate dikinase [Mycobacterium sp. QGD 101]